MNHKDKANHINFFLPNGGLNKKAALPDPFHCVRPPLVGNGDLLDNRCHV